MIGGLTSCVRFNRKKKHIRPMIGTSTGDSARLLYEPSVFKICRLRICGIQFWDDVTPPSPPHPHPRWGSLASPPISFALKRRSGCILCGLVMVRRGSKNLHVTPVGGGGEVGGKNPTECRTARRVGAGFSQVFDPNHGGFNSLSPCWLSPSGGL